MPKLIDFDPQWIDTPDRKGLGFTFRCTNPLHKFANGSKCVQRMAVLFANPLDGGPPFEGDSWKLEDVLGNDAFERGCGAYRWKRKPETTTFETLTLAPSINAYECGHFTVEKGEWAEAAPPAPPAPVTPVPVTPVPVKKKGKK